MDAKLLGVSDDTQLDDKTKDHAPNLKKLEVDLIDITCAQAKKILNKLGDYIPATRDHSFDGLMVLGPYQYKHGVYHGQYYLGKAHGFGTFVSF